jgi:Flp pilus assembly protein TadG
MLGRRGSPTRRGLVLPLVAVALVGLVSLAALAVDLGLVAAARTQAQAAADAAALAGARALNGARAAGAGAGTPITTADNNYASAGPQIIAAATQHSILGRPVSSSAVQATIGKYYYDSSLGRFVSYPIEPGSISPSNANWSLVRATVTHTGQPHFASFLGFSPYNITAHATAVHRPRDVAIVLDFSGSMRFGSLLGIPHSGARTGNNPEAVFPSFGHYSAVSTADLRQTNSVTTLNGNTFQATNTTASEPQNQYRPPIVEDFYRVTGNSPQPAFVSAGNGNAEGLVSGDNTLKLNDNTSTTYSKTVNDALSAVSGTLPNNHARHTAFESNGYDWSGFDTATTYPTFQGYTVGPRYWGKTFFVWPPDPRGVGARPSTGDARDNGANDWRKRFFFKSDGTTPVDDNSLLWITDSESSTNKGSWRSPRVGGTTYYRINYRAILHWLFNSGPNPFPDQLRAGRIVYYDSLPNPADSTLNSRFWAFNPASPSGLSASERFWKEYVDYVLGVCQLDATTWDTESSSRPSIVRFTGYGDDFAWGTVKITAKSLLTGPDNNAGTTSDNPYMHYDDNPRRPGTHFWFGPMTMIDFLGNYNMGGRDSRNRYWWMPGTAREAPMYACKIGIQSALADIENNHPNDYVTLIFYSAPRSSASDTSNRFNRVRVPLGRQYTRMRDSLFFPPATLDGTPTVTPFDAGNLEVPRPMGGTCYAMGLMLAYNQFSGNPTLQTFNPSPALPGDAGGLGRRGAYKLVILETDGLPNVTATAGFTKVIGGTGANHSYYNIRYNSSNPASSQYPSVSSYSDNAATVTAQIYDIASRICALETDANPGFATPRKPVKIHCIGFGPLFESTASARTDALITLQQIERIGKTQSNSTPTAWLPEYKLITGNDETVIEKLRTAISTIMQDGVQVSLIE